MGDWPPNSKGRTPGSARITMSGLVPMLWVAHTWRSLSCVRTVRIHRKKHDVCAAQSNLAQQNEKIAGNSCSGRSMSAVVLRGVEHRRPKPPRQIQRSSQQSFSATYLGIDAGCEVLADSDSFRSLVLPRCYSSGRIRCCWRSTKTANEARQAPARTSHHNAA